MAINNKIPKSFADKTWEHNNTDSPYSHDPIKLESINYDDWASLLSYYRYYLDRFATDMLELRLFPFQKLILRAMARYPNVMLICCRGLGKSYLCAIFMICMAILYPGMAIGIVSGNGNQARMVIKQKIEGELQKNENIRREISSIRTASDDCIVTFKNGSSIRAITLGINQKGDSSRGWRFQLVLVDEARLVRDSTLTEVIRPMIKTPRQNAIDLHDRFPDDVPIERGRMIYISSAWLKTCDLYQKFLNFYYAMTNGDKHFFVASLDYKVGIDAGLFSQEEIDLERESPDMTLDKFAYEYEGVFVGSSNDSYYPYSLTNKCRVLDRCELEQPKKCQYEYIVTHDVAVSTKAGSDNCCSHVIKLIPKKNGTFQKQVVYTKTLNGASLKEQRDFLRKLIHIQFPNTEKLVIDARSAGQGLLSLLEEPWLYRNDKGEIEEYPPLIQDDDEETMKTLPNANPMIRGIQATSEFNSTFYPYMKSCFEDQSLQLLVDSSETDEQYKNGTYSPEEQVMHVEHDNLVQELSNIKRNFGANGQIIYDRIVKSAKRDRATSLMYGLSVVYEYEKQGKADVGKTEVDTLKYLAGYIY
nr:MAG TPA: large terminase [Caudoviricetes sp.]